MIVREILKDESILDTFDYFNDAKDTLVFLRMIYEDEQKPQQTRDKAKRIYKELDKRNKEYLENFWNKD